MQQSAPEASRQTIQIAPGRPEQCLEGHAEFTTAAQGLGGGIPHQVPDPSDKSVGLLGLAAPMEKARLSVAATKRNLRPSSGVSTPTEGLVALRPRWYLTSPGKRREGRSRFRAKGTLKNSIGFHQQFWNVEAVQWPLQTPISKLFPRELHT